MPRNPRRPALRLVLFKRLNSQSFRTPARYPRDRSYYSDVRQRPLFYAETPGVIALSGIIQVNNDRATFLRIYILYAGIQFGLYIIGGASVDTLIYASRRVTLKYGTSIFDRTFLDELFET